MKLGAILTSFILLIGCTTPPSSPGEDTSTRRYTYRAVAGVSMGGGAAAHLGFSKPDYWDFVGILGGPLVDLTSMDRMVKRNWLGGFCSYDALSGFLVEGDDLNSVDTYCGLYTDQPSLELGAQWPIVPQSILGEGSEPFLEFVSDYNNWWRGPKGGRGGSFKRVSLMKALQDTHKAFGNTLYPPNLEVPWAAPGVTEQWLALSDAEKCANPVVLQNFYNAEYNPNGSYPVITFCEGEEEDPDTTFLGKLGRIIPETARWFPMPDLLAVDYNGNGVRDYSEPVIVNSNERYEDSGTDNLPDVLELGYDSVTNPDPSGDNYNYFTNPLGTEGNYRYDPGESYGDFGLDGVAGTGDTGEGDGDFTRSPGTHHALKYDPRSLVEQLSEEQLSRLDVYLDAGIRDFLNTAVGSNAFFGYLKTRVPSGDILSYDTFTSLLQNEDGDTDPSSVPPDKIAQYTYVRYGDVDASEMDISQGDGNHVGTANQVIDRMLCAMGVVQQRWPNRDVDPSPANPFGDSAYASVGSYQSVTLGETKEFSYILPPGYHDPQNQNRRYPVLFFLHGQGQSHSDLLGASFVILSNMVEEATIGEAKWAKFITVFPDGKCDEAICDKGNFWADFASANASERYYTDFFELVNTVDARFRTKLPEEVKLD